LSSVQTMHPKCCTTNKDDHNLPPYNDELNADEPVVSENAFKNVDSIIESARAIEDQCLATDLTRKLETYLYWLKICIQTKVLKTSVGNCSSSRGL